MNGRITQLDGLRAFAIVSVFIFHAASVQLLWMGVDLFFILSGFLITGILMGAKHVYTKGC
jgi:peptidoglycan/LPS O-acetylase OafA/YrhL